MDILNVINNAFSGLNIWQIISGILAGALVIKLIDEIFLQLLARLWPEKYLEKLYSWVKEFDDKYIDMLKEKYPKSGRELEVKIANVLDKMKTIILDE